MGDSVIVVDISRLDVASVWKQRLSETKHADDFWYLVNQVSTCSDHIHVGYRPCFNFGLPDGTSISLH